MRFFLAFLIVGAIGFLGPLSQPGYELALVAGLILPSIAAVSSARAQARLRRQPLRALARGIELGAWVAAAGYAAGFLHGLRTGFCDLAGGTLVFALGPGIGAALGGAWGTAAGELARRPARATALAIAGPLGSALGQLAIFYSTPMVFAYDPFAGFFSGALYDTIQDHAGLFSYRAATLATLAAALIVAHHLERDAAGKLRLVRRRRTLALLGVALAAASATSVAYGPELGHWHSSATIAAELGGDRTVGRCHLIHPSTLTPASAERFASDCDAHITAVGAWLGLREIEPVTVFLFADTGQKRRLMGAAQTSIAKPWRREIYIHVAPYPHGSLGHELAHALAGPLGRGPFAIAGSLGGWLPDPGLIEGIAVAASPKDDELDTIEWAAAMRRIEVLPPLDALFALAFFGRHSGTSYTASGAFVSFVRARYGAETIARWYGGESLEALTGQSWGALERDWWASLDSVPLPAAALAHARARFDRPGVLARRCPHEVDATLARANRLRSSGDEQRALEDYRHVLALDPGSTAAHFGIAGCHAREGDVEASRTILRELSESARETVLTRVQALEELGDAALRAGDAAEARRLYQRAAALEVREDRLRTLEVKARYADDPRARGAIVALLVGTTPLGSPKEESLDLLGLWRASSDGDGTPEYLLARQHVGTESYALALSRLDQALAETIPLERVHDEALRLRIEVTCALGDAAAARAALARYLARSGPSVLRRELAGALVARCLR